MSEIKTLEERMPRYKPFSDRSAQIEKAMREEITELRAALADAESIINSKYGIQADLLRRWKILQSENENLSAALADREWRPIESAPKDVMFIGSDGKTVGPAWWYPKGERFVGFNGIYKPTLWMPLPKPPSHVRR